MKLRQNWISKVLSAPESSRPAIAMSEKAAGKSLRWTYSETNRIGDHIWWISDVSKFQRHYPDWRYAYAIEDIIQEIAANS